MSDFLELGVSKVELEVNNIAVYRGHVSTYKTAKGYARKVELTKMKSLSSGFDMLEEEFNNMGCDIELDLSGVIDGRLYTVEVESGGIDYETGGVDY